MKLFDKSTDPNSVVEILLQSDVYKDDVTKISNDLIMALLAGTDTSRNTTITTLCHLTKNKEHRERVREEIEEHCDKELIDDIHIFTPNTKTTKNMKFF